MSFVNAKEHVKVARPLEARWLKARETMVNANLRLVVHEAKAHQNRGLSLEDLIQSGNETLLKAADSFDLGRGCRFSTHATTRLRGELRRALDDDGRLVRIPAHVREKIRKPEGKTKELTRELGGKPSYHLLGEETGMSARTVEELMGIKQSPLSLHQPLGDESDQTLETILADNLS